MKHLLLPVLLITLCFAVHAQTIDTTDHFFKLCSLRADEIPKGFKLEPINEEAKEMGITANPGFVTSDMLLANVYPEIDKAVSTVFMGVYTGALEGGELGFYAIAYVSKAALETEIKKIKAQNSSRYFRKDNHVVIVWSDAGGYRAQVNTIANKLKARLQLQEFKPVPADNVDAMQAK